MVVRVEDRVTAVASPALPAPGGGGGDAQLRLSTAAHEGNRYVFFAVDSLLVVLHESHANVAPHNPRLESKRNSQFALWQVWDTRACVSCVAFNATTKRVARGAIALCLDEGRVALLTPTSGLSHLATAAPPAPAALPRVPTSRLTIKTGTESESNPVSSARRASLFSSSTRPGVAPGGTDVTREYVKVHLQLQLPTWQESIRWKADDDRSLERIAWLESGDDLWLVGAGEKITTWKLVEESGVVAYQQLSVAVGDPDQRVWHMSVTATSRFVATAGKHDRVLKLWSLQDLAHDGTPVCLFLPHSRALVSVTWAKHHHAFKLQAGASQSEMLYTLDRAGTISIWRENLASPSRAFTLWKALTSEDVAMRLPLGPLDTGSDYSPIKSWTLVVNDWGRDTPRTTAAGFTEVLLEEANVMAALSQFHYGYTSLDEVRRNELVNQRMDNIPKANAKLLGVGGRVGATADTHAGEAFIAGNLPLHKTFLVHLGVSLHANGDLSLFRIESIPFAGVSPKTSLLCLFTGLKDQLAEAVLYTACSADYKDRENGSASFLLELLFQPRGVETQLKVARLKFQVESGSGFRSVRANVSYTVQMCEVGDASPSLMSAYASDGASSMTAFPLMRLDASGGHLAVLDQDVLRAGSHLGALQVMGRRAPEAVSLQPIHTAQWSHQKIRFTFSNGKLHAASLSLEPPVAGGGAGPPTSSSKAVFSDDDADHDGLAQLIVCGVSASQKKAWSAAPTSFFFSAPPVDTPVVLKDFCVVIGLKHNRRSLLVWVFSMDPPAPTEQVTEENASPFKLFRRVEVDMPEKHTTLRLAATPSLESFETLFMSVCEDSYALSLWGFMDMDDLSSLVRVHSTDLTPMLQPAAPSTDTSTVMQFTSFTQPKYEFRDIAVSACGRVALLFEETTDSVGSGGFAESSSTSSNAAGGGNFSLCIVSLFDTWHESVVSLPRNKYGPILSIQWTPPVAPSLDCQLVFLSSTTVGAVRVNPLSSNPSDVAWSVAWSSSRLSIKPQLLSSMDRFPQAYLALGTGVADFNLADLAGSASAALASPMAKMPPTVDVAANTSHPITLLFLLMRGSFSSLDKVLQHVHASMVEHEKTCYLKMLDDQELRRLPLLKLEQLLGKDGGDKDERSLTFTTGKRGGGGGGGASSTVTSRPSLARASDLFAMDFGSVRRSSLALGLGGGGDNIFGSSATSTLSESIVAEEVPPLALEGSDFTAFFQEHKSSLAFLDGDVQSVFLEIVSGAKKIIAWDKDTSRKKDEPTMRFAASLLWPYKAVPSITSETPVAGDATPLAPDDGDSSIINIGGICSEQVAWAAISDYQNELLQECFPAPTFTLHELYQLRLPFWVKSAAKLAQLTEKAAQAEYAATRDPFRVALLYVLLGKAKLLISLFKMANEPKIADLLANDFTDPRWKNAAVKNAYVLKAKRRHELSATFFVLGGKVQEATSVAEHADPTLVLSFLIARLSEKWDLGGGDGSQGDTYTSGFGDLSFTGLSANMRTFDAIQNAAAGGADAGCRGICKDYLKTAVWTKAQACGDVFMSFLVRFVTGEMTQALQALLTVPSVGVTCMFETTAGLESGPTRGLYWRVFGQSLLGASDLVRYLRPSIPRVTAGMKVQAVQLQAITLHRLFGVGWNIVALYQQKDFATEFKQVGNENAAGSAAVRAAYLAARNRIVASVVSGQSVALAEGTVKSLRRTLATGAAPAMSAGILEDLLDDEIQCLLTRAGSYELADRPETLRAATDTALRATVVDTLHQTGHTPLEAFVFAHWNSVPQQPRSSQASPLHQLLEAAIDGVEIVAAGDLVTLATASFHSKRVDQVCLELLGIAEKLLLWLAYFFHGKRPAQGTGNGSSPDSIRVVTASVYSIICLGCRYVKSPCCVYRSLSAIFPHLDALPKKTLDDLKDIALADVCVHCTAAHTVKEDPLPPTGMSSLQRDIPVLFHIVRMLQESLHVVVEEVRTNRLDLLPLTSFYSYCQYWTLVLCLTASKLPSHLTKVAVDGASPHSGSTALATKLVHAWSVYAAKIVKYSSRLLLCDFTESYFRPFQTRAPSTPTGSTPGTPKDSISGGSSGPSSAGSAPNPSPNASSASQANTLSPLGRDRRESRQLLRCTCDRCPWLLLLRLFADKDELLLRLNSQLECCSEKIKEEISWGHLPDFPSKKAALTRSQKILLSTAAIAGNKGPDLSELLEKRILQGTPTIQLAAQCIYRSDVSIKSLCFNRATETAELVLCSSKGICRTAAVEYSDGTKYQFKGMYAAPQATDTQGPMARRKTATDASPGHMRAAAEGASRGGGGGADAVAVPAEAKTPSFKPTAIEPHPFLPLFVSGNHKGKMHLWSYESLSAVCEFQTKDVVTSYTLGQSTSSRRDIKKIRFDSLGQQMGAVDSLGRLFMWKFANLDREPSYCAWDCHDKGAKSLQFINSSTIIATAGSSSDKRSVCMWDLLLPNSKAQIAAPACHPAGAASLMFSPTHQLLISGGEGGSISVFDVRQRRVLHTITNAHETAITTLELHPSGRCVLSGSASGDVKIWSLPIFRELVAVSKVHAKPSFLGDAASNLLGDAASNMAINVTNSSWGVTDAFATDDYFFTSGTDGSVQRFRVPSLSRLF